MDVLIVGAGIGGLTAALSLHDAGLDRVRIVEAVPRIEPLGVGINLLPHGTRALAECGLESELAARGVATAELAFYNRYGSLIWSEPRGLAAGYRYPQFSIHRGDLQALLLDAVRTRLGPEAVRTGARVVGFADRSDRSDRSGRIEVTLADPAGQRWTVDADLVIGADGIHSAVRAQLYPAEGDPVWSRVVLWRGVTWGPPFLSGRSMILMGTDTEKLVVYPIREDPASQDSVLINWVALRRVDEDPPGDEDSPGLADWVHASSAADVLRHFAGWHVDWLDIPALFRDATVIYRYPMVDRDPLPRWTFGRVTLLGDAAHPMYPFGSNGAAQAILDARALARCVAAEPDPGAALTAYEEERRPVTARLQASNRRLGPEVVIDLAHRRAPNGFTDIEDVVPRAELERIAADYRALAGFDQATVNAKPAHPE